MNHFVLPRNYTVQNGQYLNLDTGVVTPDAPPGSIDARTVRLQEPWRLNHSATKNRPYFYNSADKTSLWTVPEQFSETGLYSMGDGTLNMDHFTEFPPDNQDAAVILPPGWEARTKTGRRYFYNPETRETRIDLPNGTRHRNPAMVKKLDRKRSRKSNIRPLDKPSTKQRNLDWLGFKPDMKTQSKLRFDDKKPTYYVEYEKYMEKRGDPNKPLPKFYSRKTEKNFARHKFPMHEPQLSPDHPWTYRLNVSSNSPNPPSPILAKNPKHQLIKEDNLREGIRRGKTYRRKIKDWTKILKNPFIHDNEDMSPSRETRSPSPRRPPWRSSSPQRQTLTPLSPVNNLRTDADSPGGIHQHSP
jgi:hypothetical protein